MPNTKRKRLDMAVGNGMGSGSLQTSNGLFYPFFGSLLLLSGLVWMVILTACAPSKPPVDSVLPPSAEAMARMRPQSLEADVLYDRFNLSWTMDRTRRDVIRGYNVYVSEEPSLSELSYDDPKLKDNRYRLAIYPGDTDGDINHETIAVENLTMGVRYFVHVRTVFPHGHMSAPSEEITVIPRPRGRLTLGPRFSSDNDGFSFRQNIPVPGISDANDVYVFVTANGPYLASPSRIDRSLRQTRFVDLGKSQALADYPLLPDPTNGKEKTEVFLYQSIAIILEDGRFAKLRPVEITGKDKSLRIVFEYVYQPITGENYF